MAEQRFCKPQDDSINPQEQTTCDRSPTDPTYNPTLRTGNGLENAELRAVIDAWPALPEAVKAGIMAMVAVATGHGEQ